MSVLILHVFFTTAFVFCVLCYLVYKYLTVNYDHWKKKGIPYKTPKFLFGNYKDFLLMRKNIGMIHTTIYDEFPKEKFVGCFKGRRPELLLKDPEMIKQVLSKDFSLFTERSLGASSKVEIFNKNLFELHGEQWRAVRQKLSPVFTSGKLRNMFPLIVQNGETFQQCMHRKVIESNVLDIKDLMQRFTMDIIASVAFGVQTNILEDSDSPFRYYGMQFFAPNLIKTLKIFIHTYSPALSDLLRLRILYSKEMEQFYLKTVREILKDRKEQNIVRNDFLDLLDGLRDKGVIETPSGGDANVEFNDEFLTAQATLFFTAGFETSSSVMSFALFELAMNPEIQHKVFCDIDTVTRKYGGKINYDALFEMHYLEYCVNETMRKYPVLGILDRVSLTNYTFPGTNVTVEKGCGIVIPVYSLHYDPKYFPDPDKFIPERFTPEEKCRRPSMVYLPFGEGPRNCIASRFGKMEVLVGLYYLLSKFTVELCDKTENPIPIDATTVVMVPSNEIFLKVKPR